MMTLVKVSVRIPGGAIFDKTFPEIPHVGSEILHENRWYLVKRVLMFADCICDFPTVAVLITETPEEQSKRPY